MRPVRTVEVENLRRLWIIDSAVAEVNNGVTTLRIDKPVRSLPSEAAYNVATDKVWFSNQMAAIRQAVRDGENVTIPLTKNGFALRLGGGFLHIQGRKMIMPRRDADAPTRPLVLCECGGLFEENRSDFLESALAESAEVIRLGIDDTLYIPSFSGTMASYNQPVRLETIEAARSAGIYFSKIAYISVDILPPRYGTILRFADSIPIHLVMTHEIDTSSLEFVGLMRYDDLAVARFQDTEGYVDVRGQFNYLGRETHVVNYLTGQDTVWQKGMIIRSGSLTDELRRFDLTVTKGMYTNEKVEEAIKRLPFNAPALDQLLIRNHGAMESVG